MQVLPSPTIQRITLRAFNRPAFLPMTCPAEVPTFNIRQKNIRASIQLLSPAFDFSAQPGQRLKINIVIN